MRVGRGRRFRVRYKTQLEEQRDLNTKEDRVLSHNWYYLVLVLVVLSIIAHLPLLAVLGVLFFLVLAVTDIWAAYCLNGVSYRRRLSENRVMFGEEVTLSLVVENEKILPLPWLETSDTVPRALPIQGYSTRKIGMSGVMTLDCLFSPGWYDRVTRNYTISCIARGVYTFGPTVIRSGDVFGFVSRETQFSEHQYLLVYPLVVPITSLNLPARHPFGDRRAPRRLLEDPSRVVGVRDYAYGDSLRRVNWKATARTMELQSKVYEATTTYTVVMFLNGTMRLDDYYGIHPELHELAICAAASLANWCIDQGYAVGLYSNSMMSIPDDVAALTRRQDNDAENEKSNGNVDTSETKESTERTAIIAQLERRRIRVSASSNEAQRQRIMDVLARIQSYFGTSIEDVIQAERTHVPTGSTVVVITSNISDALLDNLARLRQRGHVVSILFVGDAPPPLRLSGVTVYHIGGEETWKQFMSAYGGTVVSDENARVVVEAPALHL
ncbi:MAG TPA: hypothetical protein DHW02_12530 [Ktedonobacter sp.]|nr:hypothetical protein [Ktedonobacter sp.]